MSNRRRVAVAATVLALLAGACSSGSGKSPASSPASTTPLRKLVHVEPPSPCVLDPGVTARDIKIGVIATLTGFQGPVFSEALTGLEARVGAANKAHAGGRRKITLVTRDDAGDQSQNEHLAHDLVEKDKVWLVVELSAASDGGASYLQQHGIPVTGWQAGATSWSSDANMFTFRLPSAPDSAHVFNDRDATVMKQVGATKVAIVGGGEPESVAFLARNRQALKAVGIPVVYDNETTPMVAADFTKEAQRIKASKADGLLSSLTLPSSIRLATQLTKSRVLLKGLQLPGGYSPRAVGRAGMQGALLSLEFKPFEANPPAYDVFAAAMPKKAVRDEVSYIGWLAGEITVQGISDAGVTCPTRDALIANLRLEHAYTGGGAFDPVDLQRGLGREYACAYYVKVVNRQFVPQFGGAQQCGKSIGF